MGNNLLNVIKQFDINENEFIPHGFNMGKIDYKIINRLEDKPDGKLILVTSINPTSAGEGKTTVSIGLADGLNKIGKKTVIALREPSLGPIFGIKGGATGGGLSSVVPSEDINLHFNGDFHAITSAHNLLSSLIDNHIYFGNNLKIKKVLWPRALDVNDRSLRYIKTNIREVNFVITAASEIMAILALASNYKDLKLRLNNILIGFNENNNPIYVKDLNAVNALLLLLKNAINPNVVLTKENNLTIIHAGPFANIAHGCNSIIATKTALKLGDYVVTEAGFGSDLGMEKFLDIKLRTLKKDVSIVVLVATINSLKAHGNAKDYLLENMDALKKGIDNLLAHIEIIKSFNLDLVIALNQYNTDTKKEIDFIFNWAKDNNVEIVLSNGFNKGSLGTTDLASAVVRKIDETTTQLPLKRPYELSDSPQEKIVKLAKSIYQAKDVVFTNNALNNLEQYSSLIENLPVCMAKTPLSLSGNAKLVGRPKDFTLTISEIRPSLGAGFFVALTEGIYTMPGLNRHPNAYKIKEVTY